MSDQERALDNVLKELSEMRARMNSEEQEALDFIVTSRRRARAYEETEVEPHIFRDVADEAARDLFEIRIRVQEDRYIRGVIE